VELDASGSSDSDGDGLEYRFDQDDDGSYEVGWQSSATADVSYGSSGTYTAVVQVRDEHGKTDTATTSVEINKPNQPPTASFSWSPSDPNVGETVSFDASGSSDDKSVTDYDWDWDDDGSYETTGKGNTKRVDHSFSSPGPKDVTLRVTDNDGATDTVTKTVEVNGAPTAKIEYDTEAPDSNPGPCDPCELETIESDPDGTASTDPNGDIQSYTWRVDKDQDGTYETTDSGVSQTYEPPRPDASKLDTGCGTYDQRSDSVSNSWDLELTVTDDHGQTDTDTATIEYEIEEYDSCR
jgi:PKD repeat protein